MGVAANLHCGQMKTDKIDKYRSIIVSKLQDIRDQRKHPSASFHLAGPLSVRAHYKDPDLIYERLTYGPGDAKPDNCAKPDNLCDEEKFCYPV